MVAGTPPIRAKKARYFEDARFQERILPPPKLVRTGEPHPDDWSRLPIPARLPFNEAVAGTAEEDEDPTESERRRQPELSRVKPVEKKEPIENEFEIDPPDEMEEEATRNRRMARLMQSVARQVSLDPNDGMEL